MRYAILFSTLCLTLIIAVNTTTQWQIGTLFGDELSITEPHTRVVNNANSDFAQASSFSLQSQVIGNGGGVASGGVLSCGAQSAKQWSEAIRVETTP